MTSESSDLPPAYHSLKTSTVDIPVAEESIQNSDDGPELLYNGSFEDKNTRIGFLQKVLTINLLQVLMISLVVGVFAGNSYSMIWHMRYSGCIHYIVLSTFAFIATRGLLAYCNKARRENPYRYLFLVAHPLSFAFFVSFPVIQLEFMNEFALAWANYAGAIFAVMLYTVFCLQTKLEFAARHAILIAGAVQLLVFTFTVPFIYINGIGVLYISLVFTIHYVYIFWDLQYMTSKKYWHDITPDQFVDGALNLHLDPYFVFKNVIRPQLRKCTA